MRTETTTQNIERTTTTYRCEEEGCDYSTTDKRGAEEHPWRKHKPFKKTYLNIDPNEELRTESTLVLLINQEEFEIFLKKLNCDLRPTKKDWHGPGWYETWTDSGTCARGCCSEQHGFIRPAAETLKSLKETRTEIDEAIEMLEEMEVEHVVG